MDSQRYQRAKTLFLAATKMAAEEIPDFLKRECGGDAELREEVESLLRHYQTTTIMRDPSEPTGESAPPATGRSFGEQSTRDAAGPVHRQSRARFAPGTVIAGRYRILGPLGRGGMGEVYRADDLQLDQPVALKFLLRGHADDPAWLDRFHNEVRLARKVTHANVNRVYDIGQAEGEAFISMEFVAGEDLASLLRRIGRLPGDKAVQVARQLCAGLGAAHDRNVLHRDLKPANIMIDENGQVRITDFGIASLAADGEQATPLAGTPAFMAPELFEGKQPSVHAAISTRWGPCSTRWSPARSRSTPRRRTARTYHAAAAPVVDGPRRRPGPGTGHPAVSRSRPSPPARVGLCDPGGVAGRRPVGCGVEGRPNAVAEHGGGRGRRCGPVPREGYGLSSRHAGDAGRRRAVGRPYVPLAAGRFDQVGGRAGRSCRATHGTPGPSVAPRRTNARVYDRPAVFRLRLGRSPTAAHVGPSRRRASPGGLLLVSPGRRPADRAQPVGRAGAGEKTARRAGHEHGSPRRSGAFAAVCGRAAARRPGGIARRGAELGRAVRVRRARQKPVPFDRSGPQAADVCRSCRCLGRNVSRRRRSPAAGRGGLAGRPRGLLRPRAALATGDGAMPGARWPMPRRLRPSWSAASFT